MTLLTAARERWAHRLSYRRAPRHCGLHILLAGGCLALVGPAGCKSSTTGTPMTVVSQPAIVSLYPSTDHNRLYVFVRAIGSQAVSMPLIFDTGSAGITLDATRMGFPSGLLTASGFSLPVGSTSTVFNGIIITDQHAEREYGGANGILEHGNIGYAQVTFGDPGGELMTREMPIFLYYSVTKTTAPYADVSLPEAGIFGVDDLADEISVSGPLPPQSSGVFPECSLQSTGNCYTASVLKYLSYGAGIDAGFFTVPSGPLPSCDIDTPAACMPKQLLEVGVDGPAVSTFSRIDLECPPVGDELPIYYGPKSLDGYAVCEKSIPDGTITLSGATQGYVAGRVLFDSGSPNSYVYPASDTRLPSAIQDETSVLVSLPTGFDYSYTSVAGTYTATSMNPEANNHQSHIGIGYFTTNFFLIDYSSGVEGWK